MYIESEFHCFCLKVYWISFFLNFKFFQKKSSLHYYCLNGLYHTMASLASEGQRMYPGDQAYRFYSGCALAFENRIQEAIREFENCVNDRDLTMAGHLALIYSHSKCQIIGL